MFAQLQQQAFSLRLSMNPLRCSAKSTHWVRLSCIFVSDQRKLTLWVSTTWRFIAKDIQLMWIYVITTAHWALQLRTPCLAPKAVLNSAKIAFYIFIVYWMYTEMKCLDTFFAKYRLYDDLKCIPILSFRDRWHMGTDQDSCCAWRSSCRTVLLIFHA